MCAQSQTAAVEHLAKAIYFERWEESLVAIYTAYFDASGHPNDTDVLSVAGFVAEAAQWIEFERNWKEILTRSDFQVSSLHMKHFCHSIDEYASWRNDERRRRNFLNALIATIKTRVRYSFANSLYLPDYRQVDAIYELHETIPPLAYCGGACVGKVLKWAHNAKIAPSDIAFFFEDGDQDRWKMAQEVSRAFNINVNFMKKPQSSAFQAADLLAYEQFRANLKVVPAPGTYDLSELRNPVQKLIEIPNDWGVTEKPDLERFCIEQRIPER